MSGYTQAIPSIGSPSATRAEVSPWAAVLIPSFGAVVFAAALCHALFLSGGAQSLFRDSDTGWHIRNGEAILAAGSVPTTDAFSYTRAGQPWFAWEWLSDVLLATAHRASGTAGVALLAGLAIALTAWGAARLSLALGGNIFITAGGVALLLGTTSIHWLARPHVFSWVLSLAFIGVAEMERRNPGQRWLAVLPPLACLWANLHGSFLLGPGILFVYAMGEWIGRRFAVASLASLLATFINPYGWRLHEHVFAYLRNEYLMDHISEFRSFSFHAPGALYVELFLAAAVAGTFCLIRQRAWAPAVLAAGMLHLSLYSARHFATAAVLLVPLSVAAITRELAGRPRLRRWLDYSERLLAIDRKVWGVAPVMVLLLIAPLALNAMARSGSVGFDPDKFPVRAAEFLEAYAPGARIFAKDQWGGYLIYHFNGRTAVFIDGRSDFYGQNHLETYAQVNELKPGWDRVLDRFGVRFVLVAPEHPLVSALALKPGWVRVHSDYVAVVFERAGN